MADTVGPKRLARDCALRADEAGIGSIHIACDVRGSLALDQRRVGRDPCRASLLRSHAAERGRGRGRVRCVFSIWPPPARARTPSVIR